jgi:sialate O-acetylesterase
MLMAVLATLAPAAADVRLPGLFSHSMVIQQGTAVPVWGWAEDGEKVTVQFRDQRVSTVAKNGKWMVRLAPVKPASVPDFLAVSGKNMILLRDVLVGEVWVCSGQSNMEWPMKASFEPNGDIASANDPNLRLFTVPKRKALEPVDNVDAEWKTCSPDNVRDFSAVAYYFGRALSRTRKVAVGLIHTSWGGSPAEVWMSQTALTVDPEYRRDIWDKYAEQERNYKEALAQWEKEKAAAEKEGKKFERGQPWPAWRPAELYNGMIAPLIPYAIAGAIWYQGESNAGRAWQYRRLFPDMILNWRRDWGQGDFPFLAVQLAPWDKNKKRGLEEIVAAPVESDWAELREAQVVATKVLPNVELAIITDVGDKDDIHPVQKAVVGERLALAARDMAYGEPFIGRSPVFKSVKFSGGKATVEFDRVGKGLKARDGELKGFAIAGADGKFVWADARISGKDKVVVSSQSVSDPVAVRFGWSDFPVVNLYSEFGLPVSPFRTDDLPATTAPKKQ